MIYINMTCICLHVYMHMNEHSSNSWQVFLIDCWFLSNVARFVALWMTRLITVMWFSFNFCHVISFYLLIFYLIYAFKPSQKLFLLFCHFHFFLFFLHLFNFLIQEVCSKTNKQTNKNQTQTKQTLKNQNKQRKTPKTTTYELLINKTIRRENVLHDLKEIWMHLKKRKTTRMNGKSPDKKHNCSIILFLLWSNSHMVNFNSKMRQWVKEIYKLKLS